MKTFEIYMIEEDFLRTYNLKRNELFFMGIFVAEYIDLVVVF